MSDFALIMKATQFAAERHVKQRRKGDADMPYVNHVIEVAHLLAAHGADTNLIVAGLLHDTVEDTDTTEEELAALFGADVAGLVKEVSDDKGLTKAERKRLQIEKAPHKSDRAKMLGLADKIANLNSLMVAPPTDWDRARIVEYFKWAKAVVAGYRGCNAGLEEAFDKAYQIGMAYYGQPGQAAPQP